MDSEEEGPLRPLPEHLRKRQKVPVAEEYRGKTRKVEDTIESLKPQESRHTAPPEMTPEQKKAWKRAGEELWEKREGKRTTLEETASRKKEAPKEFRAVEFEGQMYTPEAAREKLEDLERFDRIFRNKPDETVIGKGEGQRTLGEIRDSYEKLKRILGAGVRIEPEEEFPES